MIDRHPALIVRCADVADVMAAVKFTREHDLLVSIRSGGHNGPGLALCDGGLVIDLSRLKGIRVDPVMRIASVEAGCTWGDVDHATHAFGLATVSGIISTTEVGGLTLGGGHGHLTRKYGLTIDNLLAADVILADGRLVTASANEHADLFWALRGGGGNFGVVTAFLFQLHPVHTVYAGPIFWRLDDAAAALRFYQRYITEAPEEMNAFFAFMQVPPAPPFPEALHGQTVCGVVCCYAGPQAQAEEVTEPLRQFGPPLFEHLGPMPYPKLQSAFDALYQPLAVGSAFKLAILAALQDQITIKQYTWDAVVRLKSAWKSLPSSVLKDWPDGSPVTLHTLATLMISQSDNTAADALVHIVGREAVERYTRRNQPFLTTQEAFKLKAAAHADLAARYRRGNEAEKRQVLQVLVHLPLPDLQALPSTPTLDVEWYFTARELCGLMAQVAGLDVMTVSPGPGGVKPDQWARIAYKGGSEPGVLNLTYWLKTKDGTNYCIAATQNRADAPINE